MGRASPSSSIDSSNNHLLLLSPSSSPSSSSSSICHSSNHATSSRSRRDLSTDLQLGLSLSPARSQREASSILTQRDHQQGLVDCWPPIKPLLRSTLAGKPTYDGRQPADSLFVKVYMEGIPIGRKLDLFRHEDYDDLVTTLARMFKTNILRPNGNRVHSDKYHVLTYEDKDGDWMMVGDVPWEMFVTTVKRLKITRADRC